MAGIGDYIHYSQKHYLERGTNRLNPMSNVTSVANKIFDQHHKQMRDKIAHQQGSNQLKQLEEALNAIYYPKDGYDPSAERKRISELYKAVLEDAIQQWAINWKQGGDIYQKNAATLGAKSFDYGSLAKVKKKIEIAKDKLAAQETNSKEAIKFKKLLDNTIEQLEQLDKEVQAALGQEFNTINNKTRITASTKSQVKMVGVQNQLTRVNNLLNQIGNNGRALALGESFEVGIASLDDGLQKVIDTQSQYLVNNVLTGTKRSSLGQALSIGRIDIDIQDIWSSNLIGKNEHGREIHETINLKAPGNDTLEIKGNFGEGSDQTTYKMDVNLTFKDQQYRISAKNYKMADKKTITLMAKSSPLLNILMRTNPSNDFINHYLNIMAARYQNPNSNAVDIGPNSLLHQARQAAEASIIIEALTGMSQVEGYSNTLVVNNRSLGEIRVLNMSDLINKYYLTRGETSPFNVKGNPDFLYSANFWEVDNINNNSNQTKSIPSKAAAKRRIARLLAYAQSVKVGASLNTTDLWKSNKS